MGKIVISENVTLDVREQRPLLRPATSNCRPSSRTSSDRECRTPRAPSRSQHRVGFFWLPPRVGAEPVRRRPQVAE
jgi:hypothetical protein